MESIWKKYTKLKQEMDLGSSKTSEIPAEIDNIDFNILYSLSRFEAYSDFNVKNGKPIDLIGPSLSKLVSEIPSKEDDWVDPFNKWLNVENTIEGKLPGRKAYFLFYKEFKQRLEFLEKRKLVKGYSYKNWAEEFNSRPKIERGEGNSKFYRITGRGILYFELALTLPSLGPAYFYRFALESPDLAFAFYGCAYERMLLKMGILLDEHRTKWSWDFISTYQPPLNRVSKLISDEFENECMKLDFSIYDKGLELLIAQEFVFLSRLKKILKTQITRIDHAFKRALQKTDRSFYNRTRRTVDFEAMNLLQKELDGKEKLLLKLFKDKTKSQKITLPKFEELVHPNLLKLSNEILAEILEV